MKLTITYNDVSLEIEGTPHPDEDVKAQKKAVVEEIGRYATDKY